MEKKGVLFISYIYLPQQTGGTQRICQFFDGIDSSINHNVFLITSKYYPDYINSIANIYRVHDVLKYFKSKRKIQYQEKEDNYNKNNVLRSIKKLLFLLCCIPDESITFIPFGVYRAIQIANKNRIDYVFSTFPPATNLVTGYIVSLILNKKHIVDLREPWLDKPDWLMKYSNGHLCKIRVRLENYIEQIIMCHAHKIILNHPWMKPSYMNLVGNDSSLTVIPNGFDENLISQISNDGEANRRSTPFMNIIYTGSYYLSHQPEYVFAAIRRAIEKESQLKDKVVFNFYGTKDEKTNQLIKEYSSIFKINYYPYIAKDIIFKRILDSDLGVVSVPPESWGANRIPSKIYEYKKLCVPLLILGERNSALQNLAKEFGEPFFYAKDVEGIANYIINQFFCCKITDIASHQSSSIIDEYAYSKLIKNFLEIFI